MTTDRIKGNIVFYCDRTGCEDFLETETSSFSVASAARQEEGWTVRNISGDWHHYCPLHSGRGHGT